MRKTSEGFTAVEVLVTLLVAFVLIVGAYQGYGLVTSNSADSRNLAEANGIGYESLRRNLGAAPSPCVATTTPIDETSKIPSGSTLPTPRSVSVSISCPYGTSSRISLVTVTVAYGTQGAQVVHADYARN